MLQIISQKPAKCIFLHFGFKCYHCFGFFFFTKCKGSFIKSFWNLLSALFKNQEKKMWINVSIHYCYVNIRCFFARQDEQLVAHNSPVGCHSTKRAWCLSPVKPWGKTAKPDVKICSFVSQIWIWEMLQSPHWSTQIFFLGNINFSGIKKNN